MNFRFTWYIVAKEYRDNRIKAFITFPGFLLVSALFFIPLFFDSSESMKEVVENYRKSFAIEGRAN